MALTGARARKLLNKTVKEKKKKGQIGEGNGFGLV